MSTTAPPGRPRSERARRAVLHAVDDMLVDIGYAAMTIKGIAERAGVGRQTVYRWWSTKAEILLEASVIDAAEALETPAQDDPVADLTTYLQTLVDFLTTSPAGMAYRALLGEAQHDPAVQVLVGDADLLAASTAAVLDRVRASAPAMPQVGLAAAQLAGPVVTTVLTARPPWTAEQLRLHAATLIKGWQ
ncbi:TetR/AcrR family transcriptional regulator [Micromonospora sp. NPDC049081]|uniref:TetR/AcrR family transcriptional regulator n=1 Tax=Micromonospora sp. NPDC049081 TaxID=3155150 RepID=UPI00340AB48F